MFITWLDINHAHIKELQLNLPKNIREVYLYIQSICIAYNSKTCVPKYIKYIAKIPCLPPEKMYNIYINNPKNIFFLPRRIINIITKSAESASDKFLTMQSLLNINRSNKAAIYYDSIHELLDDCISKNIPPKPTSLAIVTRTILFYSNGNAGWTKIYICHDSDTVYKPKFTCTRCNMILWLDTINTWKIYPSGNRIYIKHIDMLKAEEIPSCISCTSNKHFIIRNN